MRVVEIAPNEVYFTLECIQDALRPYETQSVVKGFKLSIAHKAPQEISLPAG
jgi:hypothetical protein